MEKHIFYLEKAFLIIIHKFFWPKIHVHSNHGLWQKQLNRVFGPRYIFYHWIWDLLDGDNKNSNLYEDFADLDWEIHNCKQVQLFKEYLRHPKRTKRRIDQVVIYNLALFLNYCLRLNFLPNILRIYRRINDWIFSKLYPNDSTESVALKVLQIVR
jgi:hypothetical protein